jgi:hypothetical protein
MAYVKDSEDWDDGDNDGNEHDDMFFGDHNFF